MIGPSRSPLERPAPSAHPRDALDGRHLDDEAEEATSCCIEGPVPDADGRWRLIVVEGEAKGRLT